MRFLSNSYIHVPYLELHNIVVYTCKTVTHFFPWISVYFTSVCLSLCLSFFFCLSLFQSCSFISLSSFCLSLSYAFCLSLSLSLSLCDWPTCSSFSVSSSSMLQMSGMLVFSAIYFCWDVVLPANAHNALAPCSFTDTLKFWWYKNYTLKFWWYKITHWSSDDTKLHIEVLMIQKSIQGCYVDTKLYSEVLSIRYKIYRLALTVSK